MSGKRTATKSAGIGHMLVLGLGFFALWVADNIAVTFGGDHIATAGGAVKAGVYGAWIFIIGAIVQLVTGIISDHVWTPLGRRIPFILIGAPAGAILLAVAGMALSPGQLNLYFWLGILIYFSINIFYTPYIALLPDTIVPEKQGIGNGIINIFSGAAALFVFVGLAVVIPKVSGLDNSNKLDFAAAGEAIQSADTLDRLQESFNEIYTGKEKVLLQIEEKVVAEGQEALQREREEKSKAPGIFGRGKQLLIWADTDGDNSISPDKDVRIGSATRDDDKDGKPVYTVSGLAGQEIKQIYWIGALLTLLPMLYLCLRVKEPTPKEKAKPFKLSVFLKDLFEEKEPVKLFLVLFAIYFPLGAIQIYAIAFAEVGLGFTEDMAPYLMGFVLGIIIVISVPVGILGDKMDKKTLLKVGLFMMAAGLLMVRVFMPGLAMTIVGISIFSIGMTFCMVLYYALMSLIIPPRKIGIFTGVYYFVTQVSRGISAPLAGLLIGKTFNFGNMFAMCGAVCLLGFIWIHFVKIELFSEPGVEKA